MKKPTKWLKGSAAMAAPLPDGDSGWQSVMVTVESPGIQVSGP